MDATDLERFRQAITSVIPKAKVEMTDGFAPYVEVTGPMSFYQGDVRKDSQYVIHQIQKEVRRAYGLEPLIDTEVSDRVERIRHSYLQSLREIADRCVTMEQFRDELIRWEQAVEGLI